MAFKPSWSEGRTGLMSLYLKIPLSRKEFESSHEQAYSSVADVSQIHFRQVMFTDAASLYM